jgi:antitoxin component of MazEF toxin-antitoxin module
MGTISTRLTTSGNSKAIRLPKALLELSQLSDSVELEARPGEIVIRSASSPRAAWRAQIQRVTESNQSAHTHDPDLEFWEGTAADGLDSLPWDGPTYEEWAKRGRS